MLEKLRRPIRRWPLRVVAGTVVVVAIIAGASADAARNAEVAELKRENADLTEQLSDAETDAETMRDAFGEADEALQSAEAKLAKLGDLQARRRKLRREISRLEDKVRTERANLTSVRTEVAKSTLTDGTWQANVDFIPGTYKAPGGEGCYWAKLSGPSGGGLEGIIENGGFNPNQIVSVDSPYFETSGCGTWKRVG